MPLMQGLEITGASLSIMNLIFSKIKVNKEKCVKACVPEIFATDKAIELVGKGMPFRDAYKKVAKELDELKTENPVKNIKSKKHLGATGNLGLSKSAAKIKAGKAKIEKEKKAFEAAISKLKK